MRPRTLEEFFGQGHILGPGKLLRRMLASDVITSMILHGPPGTGKTTLAEVIANSSRRHFVAENAASVGVKRIREIVQEAAGRLAHEKRRTVLFLDEIHRFSRSQQDVLLGDVERGVVTLIGATTENPLFAVNGALVSRSTLFRLEPLSVEDVERVIRAAIADEERGYGRVNPRVTDEAIRVWAVKCDGDARRALTALEVAVLSSQRGCEGGGHGGGLRALGRSDPNDPGHPGHPGAEGPGPEGPEQTAAVIVIDKAAAEDSIQEKAGTYDQTGDEHYDSASALIKSVRGSDPDAAVYWLARMLEGGEDPRFIARRLAILASEDVGNADPRAIMVAASAWELVERIGMPEARITLAQCATYLALAPKSNASYVAVEEALGDVREGRTAPVPVYLKDGNVRKAADLSAGSKTQGTYQYSHAVEASGALADFGGIAGQDYLGVARRYYRPTAHGAEKLLGERLRAILQERQRLTERERGSA